MTKDCSLIYKSSTYMKTTSSEHVLYIFLFIYFSDLQQRIPNELLSALATSLVEGPIFEIVSSLTEVQNVTEKQLFRERLQVLRGHSRKSNALSFYRFKMILDC